MRHLLNPLDLSMDELDNILNLANDIKENPTIENVQHGVEAFKKSGADYRMHTNVTANVLLHFSMSQAHEPV